MPEPKPTVSDIPNPKREPRQPTPFKSELLPEAGYELGKDESVMISVDNNSPADGVFTDNNVAYKKVARLRLGGGEKIAYIDVVAVKENDYYGKQIERPEGTAQNPDVMAFAFTGSKDEAPTDMRSFVVFGHDFGDRDETYTIGRKTILSAPSTVSWEHVKLSSSHAGLILTVTNLHPTNGTTLLRIPKPETSQEVSANSPEEEMAATRAIDAEGNIVAGPTVNAARPWELVDPKTGGQIKTLDDAPREAAAARRLAHPVINIINPSYKPKSQQQHRNY